MKFLKLRQLLLFTSNTMLGLFAGAMLFIAIALCPYWLSIEPLAFRSLFQQLAPYIGNLMLFLLQTCLILSIFTFCAYRTWLVALAGLAVWLIVPIYFFIHAPANNIFLQTEYLATATIHSLLHKWFNWHIIRTLLGLLAFTFTSYCLMHISRIHNDCSK